VSLAESDHAALRLMRTRGHDPRLEQAAGLLSRAGEHAACWLALGSAGALLARTPEKRRAWRRGVAVVASSYGLNYAVKLAVRRERPVLPGLPQLTPTVSRLSFPSAHATTSFAAAAAYRSVASAPALYALATILAVSRPYLGVHYPSDVLAGVLLGTLVAEVWPR
jgi:membrane-associated phospholipid phosphatase